MIKDELERYLELEHLRFRAALVQHRILAGLTAHDVVVATGSAAWVERMEDLSTDPHLSEIRRYATAIGAAVQHRVVVLPDEQVEP